VGKSDKERASAVSRPACPHLDVASGSAQGEALARVRRAGVRAPDSAILSWIRSIGPEPIMAASLKDIRAVANAF